MRGNLCASLGHYSQESASRIVDNEKTLCLLQPFIFFKDGFLFFHPVNNFAVDAASLSASGLAPFQSVA